MATTLSGAIGSTSYTLDYSHANSAYNRASRFINAIDSAYKQAFVYMPGEASPHFGATIIGDTVANNIINVSGFGAVIDENNDSTSTVHGGGDQIVLAGDGGLDYASDSGNVTIDAGGGNNKIYLQADMGSAAIYTGKGNDTIHASQGNVNIRAGGGNNVDYLGGGRDGVVVGGNDTIYLGTGTANITYTPFGHATIIGAASSSVTQGFSLNFIGGDLSNVVETGAGRYSIFGGVGGGYFQGGSFGGNFIQGGSGNVTIVGSSGSNDTLLGGSGTNLIQAGHGNETLGGGSGQTVFDFDSDVMKNAAGAVIKIEDFNANDMLQLSGGASAIDQALHSYSTADGSASFTLQDGTQVVLVGYHGALSGDNFRH